MGASSGLPHINALNESFSAPHHLQQPMSSTPRTNTSLRGLDLSNIRAGVKGLITLCTALMEEDGGNCSLEVLDIGAPVIHMQQVGGHM
jgi:hypothetical protein